MYNFSICYQIHYLVNKVRAIVFNISDGIKHINFTIFAQLLNT